MILACFVLASRPLTLHLIANRRLFGEISVHSNVAPDSSNNELLCFSKLGNMKIWTFCRINVGSFEVSLASNSQIPRERTGDQTKASSVLFKDREPGEIAISFSAADAQSNGVEPHETSEKSSRVERIL